MCYQEGELNTLIFTQSALFSIRSSCLLKARERDRVRHVSGAALALAHLWIERSENGFQKTVWGENHSRLRRIPAIVRGEKTDKERNNETWNHSIGFFLKFWSPVSIGGLYTVECFVNPVHSSPAVLPFTSHPVPVSQPTGAIKHRITTVSPALNERPILSRLSARCSSSSLFNASSDTSRFLEEFDARAVPPDAWARNIWSWSLSHLRSHILGFIWLKRACVVFVVDGWCFAGVMDALQLVLRLDGSCCYQGDCLPLAMDSALEMCAHYSTRDARDRQLDCHHRISGWERSETARAIGAPEDTLYIQDARTERETEKIYEFRIQCSDVTRKQACDWPLLWLMVLQLTCLCSLCLHVSHI